VSWLLLIALGAWLALGLRIHRVAMRPTRWPPGVLPTVVLGARVFEDGTPSAALAGRVETAVQLLRDGKTTRLVLSGGSLGGRPTEASVMSRLALSAGAPREALLLEDQSRSTFENALRSAELLETREILLVTCDFHLARATAYFRDRGFTVWPVPSRRPLSAANRLMVTAKEVLGLLRRPRLLAHL
jgi:uncharacterized SAM-binding protein YcdF (DUF218 family)